MNTNQEQLTEQESLEMIARMIRQAKGNVSQGSFHLLLWGWLILFASLGHFILLQFTAIPGPYRIWLIVIPGIIASFYYGFKKVAELKCEPTSTAYTCGSGFRFFFPSFWFSFSWLGQWKSLRLTCSCWPDTQHCYRASH